VGVRPIRILGDPGLRTPAEKVTSFDRALRRLAADLAATMRAAAGVGLAAPQVGVPLRVFVYEVDGTRGQMVNPTVTESSASLEEQLEGCLSLPGLGFALGRPLAVTVRGQDLDGEPHSLEASGLLARCLLHETDHLDGILYVDRLRGRAGRDARRTLREVDWEVAGSAWIPAGSGAGAPPPRARGMPAP
jgi:peptide deformylase